MIVDMGLDFDGRCAVCRRWIKPSGDTWARLTEEPDGVPHRIVHARCLPADRAHELHLIEVEMGCSA